MRAQSEYRYTRLTWAEMNDAIAMQKVIILLLARPDNTVATYRSILMFF